RTLQDQLAPWIGQAREEVVLGSLAAPPHQRERKLGGCEYAEPLGGDRAEAQEQERYCGFTRSWARLSLPNESGSLWPGLGIPALLTAVDLQLHSSSL